MADPEKDGLGGRQASAVAWRRHVADRRASLAAALSDWADRIGTSFTPERGCVLELGCGHGHWLTAYASEHADRPCLGLDRVSKRIRKANAKAEKRALSHLTFIKADAFEALALWPSAWGITDTFMLFPDPWPKKRHFRRRMVQPRLLSLLASRVPTGGRFHFRTDHAAYFAWTEAILAAHPAWQPDGSLEWPFEATSFFQDLLPAYQSRIATRTDRAPSGRDDPAWLSADPVENGHEQELSEEEQADDAGHQHA